jgi:hypothetical protein
MMPVRGKPGTANRWIKGNKIHLGNHEGLVVTFDLDEGEHV